MKNIKTIIVSLCIIMAVGAFIIYQKFSSTPAAPITTGQDNNSGGTTPPPATQTGFKDGQYTGEVASTIYGDVQVSAIINGGKMADVQILKFPDKPGHTTDLSNQSAPILKQEAITAQSANVNIVSGATQTSEGFMQSLASALAKAS